MNVFCESVMVCLCIGAHPSQRRPSQHGLLERSNLPSKSYSKAGRTSIIVLPWLCDSWIFDMTPINKRHFCLNLGTSCSSPVYGESMRSNVMCVCLHWHCLQAKTLTNYSIVIHIHLVRCSVLWWSRVCAQWAAISLSHPVEKHSFRIPSFIWQVQF